MSFSFIFICMWSYKFLILFFACGINFLPVHSYSCRLSFDPAVRFFPPPRVLKNCSHSSFHGHGIMQLLNTPVFLVGLILLPSVIPGTGVMALESLKSALLTQAQFALPAARDPKAKGALEPGVLVSRGASLQLMGRNHLPCCVLSIVEVQYFQLPPKKPNQQTEQFPLPLIMHKCS